MYKDGGYPPFFVFHTKTGQITGIFLLFPQKQKILLTEHKFNANIYAYLTILEVEVAFTISNCAEAESQ